MRGAKLKNTDFMYGCVIYTGQGIESLKATLKQFTSNPSLKRHLQNRTCGIAFVILDTSRLISHVNYQFSNYVLQGDHLGSSQPPDDMKTKVAF